jgi:hypothetical protein
MPYCASARDPVQPSTLQGPEQANVLLSFRDRLDTREHQARETPQTRNSIPVPPVFQNLFQERECRLGPTHVRLIFSGPGCWIGTAFECLSDGMQTPPWPDGRIFSVKVPVPGDPIQVTVNQEGQEARPSEANQVPNG